MITSSGRSGSTMLSQHIMYYSAGDIILKSHISTIPPEFKGKIVFIFSNPDRAAESILHITLNNEEFGKQHFFNMEGADHNWLTMLGSTANQTLYNNLLSYDALGCFLQLYHWLYMNQPCEHSQANVLAIKYENLWDKETVDNIKSFLNLPYFALPEKVERGYKEEAISDEEMLFRKTYNNGTTKDLRYEAYDNAREIWANAPPFQYLSTESQRRAQ